MDKISVIITTFNMEKYIADCLDSVTRQTFRDIQIICVDDCSTDNTVSIIRGFQNDDSRIKVIVNEKNKGLAYSRLIGFDNSDSKYVYIMDGDDMLTIDALERLYSVAEDNKLDILSFSGKVFFDDNEMFNNYKSEIDYYNRKGNYSEEPSLGVKLFADYIKNGDMYGNLVFQFIRKEFVEKREYIGIEGIRYGESPLALYLTAKRTMCIRDQLYLRRFRQGSDVTTPFNQIKLESAIIQYDFDFSLYRLFVMKNIEYSEWILRYLYMKFRTVVNVYKKIPFDIKNSSLLLRFPTAAFLLENVIKRVDADELFCEYIDSEFLSRLKSENNIIIFGNGKVASCVKNKLEKNGIEDYLIATSFGEEGIGKNKVYCIDELLDYREDCIVIIAVDWVKKRDVSCLLKEKGFLRVAEVSKG